MKKDNGDAPDMQALAAHYRALIEGFGEDPDREGLRDTPERAAKAMQFLTRGYAQSLEDIVNGALFESKIDEIVMVKDIEMYSLCEHHLLPFIGRCHVGYLPNGRVLGLIESGAHRRHVRAAPADSGTAHATDRAKRS